MLKSTPMGSHPLAKHLSQRLGPMRVLRTTLARGQWVDTALPACDGYHEIDNIAVQTRGTMVDRDGLLAPRHEGWNSRACIDAVAEPRVVRRLALNDVEQWCVRPLDSSASMAAADVSVFQPGTFGVLTLGHELLVVAGAVQIDDVDYNVGTHIVSKTRALSLVFEVPGIAIIWPTVL